GPRPLRKADQQDDVSSHVSNPSSLIMQDAHLRRIESPYLARVVWYRAAMKEADIARRIEAFDAANGGGVAYYTDKGAFHLYLLDTEAPIARLKPVGKGDEVKLGYWSDRRRWEDIGDTGGVILPLDDALEFIANEAVFWT
ncbi:hypothetical protein, partial [Yoonia sp.]|uniref:hypothetical protein n=1 Tax=Yoonia sp. TaxID=2212373 RepID=UPI003A4DF2E8